MRTVLAIPDLHIPFERPEALKFCKGVYKKWGCDTVVFLGDVLDQYCFSRYTKDPDAMGAASEFTKAKKALSKWFKAFPVAHLVMGNHDLRVYKRAIESSIPKWFMKDMREVLDIPDEWEIEREFEIDNILYRHGEGLTANARQAIHKVGQSVVYGHVHKAAIAFGANQRESLFAMAAGCLIDDDRYAFEYAKYALEKSFLGCGVVVKGRQPIFVPLPLRNRGVIL